MGNRLAVVVGLVGVCLLLAVPASAQRAVGGSWSGYSWVPSGTFQVSFDQVLLVDYDSTNGPEGSDTTSTDRNIVWSGGLGFEYFVVQNLAVGLEPGYLWEQRKRTVSTGGTDTEATETDSGFIGFVTGEYYFRVANNMFVKPGVGVGYFAGNRERPVEGTTNQFEQSGLSGFAARVELGGVFYTSANFSLRAAIVALMRFPTESPEEGGTAVEQSHTSIDAGFSLGFGYAFN